MQRRHRGRVMALIWDPTVRTVDTTALMARIEAMTYAGREPCHDSLVQLLTALSRRLLEDSRSRQVPQYVALAYWLRPAALSRLTDELSSTDSNHRLRTPRGIALHLPPTNVDTIFVYSWAMSVLSGNSNVVRLPKQLKQETQWLVGAIAEITAEHDESDRHIFCNYSYGDEVEQMIAKNCDLRMIWGGDSKVETVSTVPIRPDGLSIGFPDRKSIAIISTDAYRQIDEIGRNKLAADFFNDVFWFDQMGCGSPRLVVWIGEPGSLSADFYNRLKSIIHNRQYEVETGIAISKFGLGNHLLASGAGSYYQHFANELDVIRMSNPSEALLNSHGGGFLGDWIASSIRDLPHLITRKIQTITHFGLSEEDRSQLAASIRGRGGYRIVPVGQALQFDAVWDGVDLFEHMTRLIVVR